jgi:hypothetical protein
MDSAKPISFIKHENLLFEVLGNFQPERRKQRLQNPKVILGGSS